MQQQQTQTMTSERPRRTARVVPFEPSLRDRYVFFICGAVVLLLFVITIVIEWSFRGASWEPGFTTIWNHSLLGSTFWSVPIASVITAFSLSHWIKLNKKRQQAARYTMTVGAWQRAIKQPQPDVPALPDMFAISSERSWPTTFFWFCFGAFYVCLFGWITYLYWGDTLQAVQQGAPLLVVIINTAINLALVLCLIAFFFFEAIFAPNQQLIATREGLFSRRGNRTRFIPWQEARLFALISQTTTSQQVPIFFYELASEDTVIRWPSLNMRVNRGVFTNTPSGVTLFGHGIRPSALFPQQAQYLNIIVAERTGLQLYDVR